jgi:hypothetical protein
MDEMYELPIHLKPRLAKIRAEQGKQAYCDTLAVWYGPHWNEANAPEHFRWMRQNYFGVGDDEMQLLGQFFRTVVQKHVQDDAIKRGILDVLNAESAKEFEREKAEREKPWWKKGNLWGKWK